MRQLRGAPVLPACPCELVQPALFGRQSVGCEGRWPDRRLAGRTQGLVPLLAVDIWEHAYYLQARARVGRAVGPWMRVHAARMGARACLAG